ncbi:site-specific DNA-methyltransferase, partial [Patescibacteria group bacterium]|nr:site-specific DNA-methyltransferase [Patescibacteria group bacterium]
MPRKKITHPTTAAPVKSYKHESKRVRIPTQEESVKLSARDKQPIKKKYDYDPSFDPQLSWVGKYNPETETNPQLNWAGKKEQGAELAVPTVPIYVQEKISPEAIIARLKLGAEENPQMMLFGETAAEQFGKAVDFYKHEDNWQNRMILGDSLLVMNSLLEKEGMRGRVQTIYIDPPYGIKFGSNWQVSTRKRDVKDNKLTDFIRQPEQVKAFRDTWELGIHSYLSYLRDRLITARELLTESGSCFVQISDENVHLVRCVMDEVFGSENCIAIINFRRKITVMNPEHLGSVNDYLIYYAKNKEKLKFRKLYENINPNFGGTWSHVELLTGERRRLTKEEINNPETMSVGSKVFTSYKLAPAGFNSSAVFNFEFEGKLYKPPLTGGQRSWKTTKEGMQNLAVKKRLLPQGDTLRYIAYFDDFPFTEIDHSWEKASFSTNKRYVVETGENIVQRCLLMTTDPGDIVLDPTCGSGTTAFVSEQWGRRWITVDTSRVSLALARTRLMTAKFPYYKLKD